MRTVQDLKVGDTVFYTDVNRRGVFSATVSKVGNKLVKAGSYSFRKDTMMTNDEYQHQRFYADKAQIENELRAKNLYTSIREKVSVRTPLDILEQIAKLLDIKEIGERNETS